MNESLPKENQDGFMSFLLVKRVNDNLSKSRTLADGTITTGYEQRGKHYANEPSSDDARMPPSCTI